MSEACKGRPPAFFYLYSQGEVQADQIDDFVDAWHGAHETWAKEVPLHEFLGFTWPEYQVWVCDAGSLPAIVEARLSATPLVAAVAKRLEQMRADGRATDGTAIACLGNWLQHRDPKEEPLNEVNRKKVYVWKLATFLRTNGMVMSAEELATHLNRNKLTTSYDEPFKGGRGTYKLIEATYKWVHDDLKLPDEAGVIAEAYVKPDGTHAWDK